MTFLSLCHLTLLYADELKIYTVVNNMKDGVVLQNDFNTVRDWCSTNGFALNVNKCRVISFTRKISLLSYLYSIGANNLIRSLLLKIWGFFQILGCLSQLIFRVELQSR